MKIQVKRFSVHQTAKVVAIIAMVASFVIMLPFILLTMIIPAGAEPGMAGIGLGMLISMPLMQGIFMYLGTAVGLWFYNRVSGRIGGIEFQYEAVEEPVQETFEG